MSTVSYLKNTEHILKRAVILVGGVCVLFLVYLYQDVNYVKLISSEFDVDIIRMDSKVIFSTNKILRFTVNDLMTVAIIYAIFYKRKYVIFAFIVQLFGFFFLLPSYLVIKWHFPFYNGPLVSFLHRLTLNPILLLLLIPLFIYQKNK